MTRFDVFLRRPKTARSSGSHVNLTPPPPRPPPSPPPRRPPSPLFRRPTAVVLTACLRSPRHRTAAFPARPRETSLSTILSLHDHQLP
ncbi:hypothetical protein NL676_038212 [Syzygium grande]|nr:hypothetical protein NL676_038212 [Syzygium grande]